MNKVSSAVLAAPATMLVVGSLAGATAQVTKADPMAVRRSIYTTSAVMAAAAIATGDANTMVVTVISLALVIYVTYPIWIRSEG